MFLMPYHIILELSEIRFSILREMLQTRIAWNLLDQLPVMVAREASMGMFDDIAKIMDVLGDG